MIFKFKKTIIELFLFFISFGVTIKLLKMLESLTNKSFEELSNSILHNFYLSVLLLISIITSIIICKYFKKILEPVSFMNKESLKSKNSNNLNFKKIITKKEGLFLIVLALFFYFTYDNVLTLNDYSQKALFIVLIAYIPLSTILTVKQKLKEKNITLKEFKIKKEELND